MNLKEVEDFIKQVENELLEVSKSDLEFHLFEKDIDFPIFLLISNPDYNLIKDLHFQTNLYLTFLRDSDKAGNKKSVKLFTSLVKIKIQLDNAIKAHPNYSKKKFTKEYNDVTKSIIPINETSFKKKLKTIRAMHKLLVLEKRIEDSKEQRYAFTYLFIPFRKTEIVLWNSKIYDLRRFFDLLITNEIISPQKNFNQFIRKNFKIKNKQNVYQPFTLNSYKSANQKSGYNDNYDDWERKIVKLKHSLTTTTN